MIWDVYKRQTVDSDYCRNYFGSAGTAAEKNPLYNYHCTAVCVWAGPGSLHGTDAVSYTHLDVYKRQLYTVINVDEKERKPEQLMSVRQIWIVRVFIFFVVFMHCVLIAKICRYGNRFGDGKCYDRYIKRAWIKIFIVWVFSDSEQILIKRMEFSCYWW